MAWSFLGICGLFMVWLIAPLGDLTLIIFKLIPRINVLIIFCVPQTNGIRPHWWLVSIDSGNGSVPSSNKPLPEPMLIKFCDALSQGHND